MSQPNASTSPADDASPRPTLGQALAYPLRIPRALWDGIGQRASSSLTRRIVVLNLVGLIALLVGFLYLNQFRQGLIQARVQSLAIQGEIIAGAIAADLVVLWSLVERFAAYGSSPNKTTALGLNLILLALLAGSAWHYWGVLRRGRTSLALERWQCVAVPVLAAWALIVALVLPPVFSFR